jgi:hypothetical protein
MKNLYLDDALGAWRMHKYGCAYLKMDCTWEIEHSFYTLDDFTQEEKDNENVIYLHVASGYSICKQC